MIIEIRDLPEGQRVKQIKVDITFEAGSSPEVISTVEPAPLNLARVTPADPGIVLEPVEPSVQRDFIAPMDPGVLPETRAQKEIPDEMTNTEF